MLVGTRAGAKAGARVTCLRCAPSWSLQALTPAFSQYARSMGVSSTEMAMHNQKQTGRKKSTVVESVDLPGKYRVRKQVKPALQRPRELQELKLGFVGWGAMAQAMSLGVLRAELTSASKIMATDIEPRVMEAAQAEGLMTAATTRELVEWSDVVVMAVKPQVIDQVLVDMAPFWSPDRILVSICAGVTIDTYLQALGRRAKVVRVMPNSSALIGESATAYAGSQSCQVWELDLVHGMFASIGGATHRVPEYLLNAVTGLSGSGPAYVYMLIQALSDAGVHGGLPRSVALSLATQTVVGAGKMVEKTGQHPMVLKEGVTSPAGTTIAGVRVLERLGFNSAVIEAAEAARTRSEELSHTKDFLFGKKTGSLSSIDDA